MEYYFVIVTITVTIVGVFPLGNNTSGEQSILTVYSSDTQYKVINILFKPTAGKGLCSSAYLDIIGTLYRCTPMVQPCGCIAVISKKKYFGDSSNSSVQCLYGGFIVCVVLVAAVHI